eukprot:8237214-Ditylum_brightwellii.AAC.2
MNQQMKGNNTWVSTDGGAKYDFGSFGWVIANDSFKLCEGKGRAYGNPQSMQSLHTESVGLLAALRFLYRYVKYHGIIIPSEILFRFCDNSTVVGRMAQHTGTTITNLTNYTHLDWDIYMSMTTTIKELKVQLQTKHVYGHQDKCTRSNSIKDTVQKAKQYGNEKRKRLTWEAVLNI